MMKKIVFILLFVVTIFQLGKSQISIGGMAGVNYSKLRIVHDVPWLDTGFPEMDFGRFAGLNSSFVLAEKFNFLGDLKYAIRGYRYLNSDVNHTRRFRISYFELAPKVEFRPSVNIGFALGVNFGIYGEGKFKKGKEDWQSFTEEMDSYTSNFALTGSVRGYLKNFFIEAGFEYGFKSVLTRDYTDFDGNLDGDYNRYFRNFNLGAGYLFEL